MLREFEYKMVEVTQVMDLGRVCTEYGREGWRVIHSSLIPGEGMALLEREVVTEEYPTRSWTVAAGWEE